MPAYAPIQTSFDKGELSTRLRGREDAEVFKGGLAFSENWEHLPLGPIRKRGGTQHIAELLSGGSRLIPFRTSAGEDFIVELGNLEGRAYNLSGRISLVTGGGGSSNLILNGTFDSTASWIRDLASISGGRARISVGHELVNEDDPSSGWVLLNGSISQGLTISAPGDYRFSFSNGGGPATLTAYITWAGGGFVNVASGAVVTLPAANITVAFAASGAYLDYVYVDDVVLEGSSDPASYALDPPWTTDQLPAVQYVMDTGTDRMVFVHPNVAPWFLQRNADGTWTHGDVVFATAPAGCSGTNWPGVVEIFGGRLWLAATPSEKNRMWASKVGVLFDFALGLGADADGIDRKIASKRAIRWMQGQRTLLVGTDGGEYYIPNLPVTTASMELVEGSAFGSAPLQGYPAGDQVLYISPDRRKPRVIGFEFQSDGWVSRDLAFLADHLTKPLIDEAHFVKAPYPAAFFKMGNGEGRIWAYDRAAQVLAGWRFVLPGGEIRSAAVTDGIYGSILWLSVARANGVYLETFRLDDDALYPVDASGIYMVTAGAISGLARLNGEAVHVIVEGAMMEAAVAAGGVAGIDAPDGTLVTVGLPFAPRAERLSPTGGNPAGSSQGMKKRQPEITVRVNASALPKVNGRRAKERSFDTTLDEATTTNFSGDVSVRMVDGWSTNPVLVLEQDLPFRCEICAVFGPMQQNTLNGQ